MKNIKNLLLFKDKIEFIEYLNSLSNQELELEFNLSDNLYSKTYNLLENIVIQIFTDFYDRPLDDICYKKIDNYKEYYLGYLNDFLNYLNRVTNDVFDLSNYANTEKLKVNSISYLIGLDNRDIKDVIIYAYDRILNEEYDGLYDRLIILINKLKKMIKKNLQELERNDDYEEIIWASLDETNRIYDFPCDQESLKKRLDLFMNLTELISCIKINYQEKLEKLIDNDTYQILEKYNMINKLSIMPVRSIIGIDYYDIADMFKNSKIIKIMDNQEEILFKQTDTCTGILYLKTTKDCNISAVLEKSEKLREQYSKNNDIDVLYGLKYGKEREIIIILGK